MTQEHRGLSAGLLGGNLEMKDKFSAKDAQVVAQVARVSEIETRLAPVLHVDAEWTAIKQDWEKLQSGGMNLSVQDNIAAHSALIERIIQHESQVADSGALTGDPDIDTYYLIDTLVDHLPEMLEVLGQTRAKGTGILAKKELSQDDRIFFAVNVVSLKRGIEGLRNNLDKVGKTNPALAGRLTAFITEISTASNDVIKMVNDDILTTRFSNPPSEYFDKATAAINSGYTQMYDTLLPTLEGLFHARIVRLQYQLAWQSGLASMVCLLLVYLFIGIYLSIMATVRKLAEGTRTMAGGDLTVRINLDCQDELTLVGDSFNQMAGSFNHLLRKVQETASSVSTAADELASSSAHVSTSSQEQSSAAGSMAAAIEQMTVSIDLITTNAKSAQQTSTQSGELSVESARIVEGAVREMQQIAETVNQSAQIIEELGHNTAKISAIVSVIKEIADQTNLLALNAAIEAARAGEQGRGFAVVADEVRKLAERTTQSTQEISSMIHSVQTGTENAVGSMKNGVARVAQGVAMSQQAGSAIGKVQEGAGQVVKSVNEISIALHEQSAASNDIARSVERIAQMAEENSEAVTSVASTAQQMKFLSNGLTDEVRRFRVS